MDKIIAQANYVVSLITGEMTQEIRENYKEFIVNYDEAAKSFEIILENLLQKDLPEKEKVNLIEKEYNNLVLENYLGEFNDYIDFFNFLAKAKLIKEEDNRLDVLKEGIEAANKVEENIKNTIYYAILSGLLHGDLIKQDIDFAKAVMNQVQNFNMLEEKPLFRIIHQAINQIN